MLGAIAQGAAWPAARKAGSDYAAQGLCRCGAPETAARRYWQCPLLQQAEAAEATSTAEFADQAIAGGAEF
eukprot:1900232-Lingulodinium_polyedra.AAC.1